MILQNICRIQTIPSFIFRSSHPEVFLGKGVLKRCSKFTGENPCRSVISIKMLCNFIEMTLWHGCSPINLLHIFRTPFLALHGLNWSFSIQNLPSRFFIFATRKLWNYSVQFFPVAFPSFLLSTDHWNPTILFYI